MNRVMESVQHTNGIAVTRFKNWANFLFVYWYINMKIITYASISYWMELVICYRLVCVSLKGRRPFQYKILNSSNIDECNQIKMKSKLFFEYNGWTNDPSVELSTYLISKNKIQMRNTKTGMSMSLLIKIMRFTELKHSQCKQTARIEREREKKKFLIQYKKIIIIDKLADEASVHHWIVSVYIDWMSKLNLIWLNIILFSDKIGSFIVYRFFLPFVHSPFPNIYEHFRTQTQTQKSQPFKSSICLIEIHFH